MNKSKALINAYRYEVLDRICSLVNGYRNLTMDTSNEGLLHPEDPILTVYNTFRDQFGRDDLLVLAIKSDNIFTIPFLTRLKKLHDQLEAEVPHVNDITSLVNARDTRGQGEGTQIAFSDVEENDRIFLEYSYAF